MRISVVMASYNYANYIEEAILSVLNQTFQDWELIIVDDKSTDNSIEIIRKYCQKDQRIKVFCNEENKGLSETLLLGFKNITGDWIAFLESDDAWNQDYLAKKFEIIEKHPEVNFIFNEVDFIVEQGRSEQKNYNKTQDWLKKQTFPKNMFYDFGVDNKILTFSCAMVKTKALLEVDFKTPYDCALDRWLWIQLAQNGSFYYLATALTKWRLHENSYIQTKKPLFYFPQIVAYLRLIKKDKNPLKLIVFILFSSFLSLAYKLKNTL